jgi:peptide/nickel transport system permease protein
MTDALELAQATSATMPASVSIKRRAMRSLRMHWPVIAGLLIVLLSVIAAIFAPWLAPYEAEQQDLRNQFAPPVGFGGTSKHWLGTDQLGRDIFSRLIFGARVSLIVGFSAVAISGTIGILLGLVAGYYRGKVDAIIMRAVELQLTFPFMLLALLVLAVFGGGLTNIVLVLSVAGWAVYARVLRSEVISTREQPYVEAARSVGTRDARLLARHIFPNVMSSMIVLATFSVAAMIVQESALSFLGLGIPPDQASWGGMLSEGRNFLTIAWWLGTFPGLAILAVVLSMNLIGDWLRDVTDPTIRQAK